MGISVFIATPCYGGNVNVRYMNSVLKLVSLLNSKDIKNTFFYIPGESLIPRARNVCANVFLNSKFTHLMFIDADIEFNEEDVLKLINYNRDVHSGSYAKKSINYEQMSKYILQYTNPKDAVSKSVNYTSIFSKSLKHLDKNGDIECNFIATGFMLIKRHVFIEMIEKYPDIKYKNDIHAYKEYEYDGWFYDFFKTGIVNNKYVSEDYGFCDLWNKIGGKVYTNMSIKLNHVGSYVYNGDPMIKYFNKV